MEVEIKDNRIKDFQELLEELTKLTYEEFPNYIKKRNSEKYYWVMPVYSDNQHLKVPEKYLSTVIQLYQEGLIDKEVKEPLNIFFSTPSLDTDAFVAESMLEKNKSMVDLTMNYRFLKLLEEQINKK